MTFVAAAIGNLLLFTVGLCIAAYAKNLVQSSGFSEKCVCLCNFLLLIKPAIMLQGCL